MLIHNSKRAMNEYSAEDAPTRIDTSQPSQRVNDRT